MMNRRPDPMIYIIEPFGGSARRQNPNLPHIFFDDAAVTRGDGVFESTLIRGGRVVNLERHVERFAHSARQTGLVDVDKRQWRDAAQAAAAEWESAHDGVEAKCTWTLSRGRAATGLPTAWLVVTAIDEAALDQRAHGVAVMTSERGYTVATGQNRPAWLPEGAKTLNYTATMAALRHARGAGFDDLIWVDGETVLEGATSTVIVVKKGRKLRTPPAGDGVLGGTSQAALFACAEEHGWRAKTRQLNYGQLLEADSVWLLSSTRGAVRVTRIDDHVLAPGDLDEEFRALVAAALRE